MRILGNRLLVKPVAAQDKSPGGIVIPEQSKDSARFGGMKCYDVLVVGPGPLSKDGSRKTMEAQPGDRVITFSYTSGALPLEDGTAIIDESLIVAIIPKDKRYERITKRGGQATGRATDVTPMPALSIYENPKPGNLENAQMA